MAVSTLPRALVSAHAVLLNVIIMEVSILVNKIQAEPVRRIRNRIKDANSVLTVAKGTPFMTSHEAKVCRRSWKWKSVIAAASQARSKVCLIYILRVR